MGNSQSPNASKRKWFVNFLSKSSPTDWIQAIFAIPGFLVVIFALYNANAAQQVADHAKTEAREATQDLNSRAGPGVIEDENLPDESIAQPSKQCSGFSFS